ncbi:uncharacterized protein LOC108631769 [Ceratina calcarata]|uniref:Uncharacterized protein LOC108631769 n=1 Tax=Ceratina calcarata TaxID=156304 RepID=A0AAJ7NEL8_9HYME|nr:uncharacterized protein LOC108631769 [Ceratina calcarata]
MISLRMRFGVFLVFVCLIRFSHGMECSFGDTNFISRALNSCPGLMDPAEKSYCCYNIEENKAYCCDSMEFTLNSSWFLITITVAVVFVVSLFIFCVSCLCCSCCPWHRRRHRGTVYGRVQVPQVVHVIETQPHVNTAYATSSAEVAQPPPYSAAVYEKQAPYNPNYMPST